MGDADYWELLESIDDFYRVHVGDLVRYARRSRNLEAILSQLIDKVGINEVTFGTLLESVSKVTCSKDGHGTLYFRVKDKDNDIEVLNTDCKDTTYWQWVKE